MKRFALAVLISVAVASAEAAMIPPGEHHRSPKVSEQLTMIRKRVMLLEQELVDGIHASSQAKSNIKKIQTLLKLQKQERELGFKRQEELTSTVQELESRKAVLDTKIIEQRAAMRRSLSAVERSIQVDPVQTPDQERWGAPRRKVLAALVDRGIKETEALRIDLADADQLEQSIADEKQQLAYMLHDLDEQQSVLELNKQLQADILLKRHQERVAQLENYQKLKSAENQVEDLIQNFNSRVELERATESERQASKVAFENKVMASSDFAKLRGRLKLPVLGGKILTHYGRAFDSKSGLFVFKKGVEIGTDKKQAVQAIYAGKVAFSGELPDYGRVTIIDHGDHFYSLCAHLGSVSKQAGDKVTAGESIGATDDSGTPVYFEIRARNVAVNPLQWISN